MNAKKLLSTLLSAAMAVSMLAGCFGGGGNKNYSDEAADAANAVQSTVVFATDAKLSKSLQDALENFTQLDDIKDAMEADENLKSLLTSGWDLDVVAEQGEDAEAAAKAIAEKYILSIVSGKKAEGKIAMVLHDGNGYYYVAVLTYGSGSGGFGSGSNGGGTTPGTGEGGEGGPDDAENNPGGDEPVVTNYTVKVTCDDGGKGSPLGTADPSSGTVAAGEDFVFTVTPVKGQKVSGVTLSGQGLSDARPTWKDNSDGTWTVTIPNVQTNINATVFFAAVDYTVKVTCDNGGESSPLGTAAPSSGTVAAGKDFVFTVTPVKGQKVSGVTLSGQGLSDARPTWKDNSDGTWTVTIPNVQTNINATVFFAAVDYTVKVTCDNGGESSPLGTAAPSSGTVAAGKDFVFTVTPVKGQKVSGVTLSGQGLSDARPTWKDNSDGTWTVTIPNVQTNINATVFFAAVDYTVKVTCDNGGESSPLGTAAPSSGTVAAGKDFVFTVTPVKGQKVSGVTLSGQGLSDARPTWKDNSDGTWTVTIPNVQTNINATVFFAAVDYTVKVTCDNGGESSPLGTAAPSSGTVAAGKDFVFTVTPVKGQKVSGVTLSGQGLSDARPTWKDNSDGTWTVTIPNVQTNINATVFFKTVKPAIESIEVHQKTTEDGILYVNETLTGKHLNVEAFGKDSDGNIIELEGIELTYDHAFQTVFDKATKYSISVTYRDANGTYYTDPYVTITVRERETTEPVVTGVEFELKPDYDGEYFDGDTIFYQKPGNHGGDHRKQEFRNNLKYRFVYEDDSYSEWKDVTQKVVEDHLIAHPKTLTGNGKDVVNVTISYYEQKKNDSKPIGTPVGSDIVKVYVQKSGNSGNN